jgi:hypothetical protein
MWDLYWLLPHDWDAEEARARSNLGNELAKQWRQQSQAKAEACALVYKSMVTFSAPPMPTWD